MTGNLILLWLAALPLMGSPGPATLSLAAMGAAFGARAGLPYLAGIIAGTGGVLLLIATGVTGLILAHPALVTLITFLAAGYILYLAWRIATAPVIAPVTAPAITKERGAAGTPSLSGGFVLAIANPKAYAAIGAVYSGNSLFRDAPMTDAIAKIAALFLVIIAVNAIWLVFGALLSSVLRNPKTGRIANIAFALMLIASVAITLTGG